MRFRLPVAVACLGFLAAGLVPAHAARNEPTTGGTVRVWPLGDSITLGVSAPESPGGYRTALDQMLTRAGIVHQFVGSSTANSSPTLDLENESHHDGHGGYRVEQIRRDLDGNAHGNSDLGGYWLTGRHAPSTLMPDAVLIHLGTNDILQRWDTRRFPTRDGRADLASAAQRSRFVRDLTGRLADLVMRIHALRPHSLIVVSTIVPIDIAGYADTTSSYADSVRRLVVTLNAWHVPVALADAYAAYVSTAPPGKRVAPGLLCDDGIHPTPAGYALLARVFATVLEGRTLPVPA